MMYLKLRRLLPITIASLILLGKIGVAQISDQEIEKIEKALPSNATVKVTEPRKILVLSLTKGYKHSAIPYAAKMLELMGTKTGVFHVVHSEDMSDFKPDKLNQFDAVFFNHTTQLEFEDPGLRKSLMDFVKSGKGIIGIHAATDNFYTWSEAAEMMGGVFAGHPWNSSGTWKVKIEDPAHPLTRSFQGKDFSVSDEIYRTDQRRLRENSRVLLGLDMKDKTNLSAEGVRIDDRDIPISWIRTFGKGRLFYCSFGHNKEIYWNPNIVQHYLDGIQYALGDLKADATPIPFKIEATVDIEEIKSLLGLISSYEYGQSREHLSTLMDLLRLTSASEDLSEEIEEEFVDFLESDATLASKQFISERLSLIGTEESVSTLVEMLEDTKTADMALYALERIPDEDVDEELRDALENAESNTKVGIITALGNRQDAKSIPDILPLINDKDPKISSAAIHAAGQIGGDNAVKALARARKNGRLKSVVTDAYLQCAEGFTEKGDKKSAYKIYREIYSPEEIQAVQYAALRGMILTTEGDASELILDALKSEDLNTQTNAIQLVREIPQEKDVSSIARALPQISETGRIQLLASLAGRKDTEVTKAMMDQTENESEDVQIAALQALAVSGDTKVPPLLAKIAATKKGKVREVARESLNRINGPQIDNTILNNLPDAEPMIKIEYIRSVADRPIIQGIPLLLSAISDTNQKIRLESIKAVRAIATPKYMEETVTHLVNPKSDPERRELEKAIIAISLRIPEGKPKANSLLTQYKNTTDVKTRVSLLEVMGKIGDPAALPTLRESLKDGNTEIQTAVIRALSSWPNSAPTDDLLSVAKTSKNNKFRVLALRGYVKLIAYESEKSREEILSMYQTAMELAVDNNEKRAVLSGISGVETSDALDFAVNYLDDQNLQQEAGATVIKIASKLEENQITHIKPVLYKALSIVKDESLQKKCRSMINQLERFEDHITLWQVAGAYDKKDVDIFSFQFLPETPDQEKADWQRVPESTDKKNYWHISMDKIYGSSRMVAYLRNKVWSPSDQEVQLELGSNDAVRAWLNEKLIHSNDAARTVKPGDDKVKVTLKKGWNRLLIKIVNVGGSWGGCARFRNLNGGHLDGLKFAIDE